MSSIALLKTEQDGIEFYTDAATGFNRWVQGITGADHRGAG